jgi:hypothetical protein
MTFSESAIFVLITPSAATGGYGYGRIERPKISFVSGSVTRTRPLRTGIRSCGKTLNTDLKSQRKWAWDLRFRHKSPLKERGLFCSDRLVRRSLQDCYYIGHVSSHRVYGFPVVSHPALGGSPRPALDLTTLAVDVALNVGAANLKYMRFCLV